MSNIYPWGYIPERAPMLPCGRRLSGREAGSRTWTPSQGRPNVRAGLRRDDDLQDGVAEEFEPLIVMLGRSRAAFVRQRRMGEGENQVSRVPERVSERRLEMVDFRHAQSGGRLTPPPPEPGTSRRWAG